MFPVATNNQLIKIILVKFLFGNVIFPQEKMTCPYMVIMNNKILIAFYTLSHDVSCKWGSP